MHQTYSNRISNPTPTVGRIISIKPFHSKFVTERQVDIWLPKGYNPRHKKPYSVIYMHDGQNLFDTKYAFNGQSWSVDITTQSLIDSGMIKPTIIVGIWNSTRRFEEYLPEPAISKLSSYQQYMLKAKQKGNSLSNDYLRFIVEELKPTIDHRFSVYADLQHTFISGSSMGGLISIYALAAYPHIFGGAACMSTHWPLILEQADISYSRPFMIYLAQHLPSPDIHRIYFDHGTETMDSNYEIHQREMDKVMVSLGYTYGKNWISNRFEGDAHNESAWGRRFTVPLQFMLKADSSLK